MDMLCLHGHTLVDDPLVFRITPSPPFGKFYGTHLNYKGFGTPIKVRILACHFLKI